MDITNTRYVKWQFVILSLNNKLLGILDCRTSKKAWKPISQAPKYVQDYLALNEQKRFTTIDTVRDLLLNPKVKYIGNLVYEIEIPKTTIKLPAKQYGKNAIRDLYDLLNFFSAATIEEANRNLYKNTTCGARLSVFGTTENDKPVEIQDSVGLEPKHFQIQTIVEGSEAEITSPIFYFGRCKKSDIENWIQKMESQANEIWHSSN